MKDLVEIPDFRTRVLAGGSGVEREIGWAHVCELPDPTEWLAAGELLLTVGIPVPKGATDQRRWLAKMAEAGLSGILICDRMYAPPLSDEFLAAADEHSLPVLLTAYEVPFTAICRTVAEANRHAEHARLLQILRVYEVVRSSVRDESDPDPIGRLADLVGCDLFVVSPGRGRSLLADAPDAPEEISEVLAKETTSRSEPMPAILRLPSEEKSAAAFHVPASRECALVAVARGKELPDLSVLHHITAIAALEVERLVAGYERNRRLGSELLAGLIDGRLAPDSAAPLLAERGFGETPGVLACRSSEDGKNESPDLHLHLEDRGVPHLLLRRAPLLTALLPDTEEAVEAFCEETSGDVPVGISDPVGNPSRVPDAHREALWALRGAEAAGESVARYGDDASISSFLPRNLSEAERAVGRVLGPILDYDEANGSELVKSLESFLENNRSWKRAADDLHVHKQTLVYRMRRVEEITGRRLDRTEDVAEMWLALRASEASGLRNGRT